MNILKTIYIYTCGYWKHVNKHDLPKHKGHQKQQIRHMTEKQIDRLMRSQTKL